jgi:hypothetical protein
MAHMKAKPTIAMPREKLLQPPLPEDGSNGLIGHNGLEAK